MAIRKLVITGTYTYTVSLPKDMIRKLKWQRGQRVEVKRKGKKLSIQDYKE